MQARDITEFEKSFCRFQIGQVSDTQVDLNQSWAVTDTTLDIRVHESLQYACFWNKEFFIKFKSSFNESDYTFIIFSDPQFGKADRKAGGDGLNWESDIRHMHEMCDNLTIESKNHAYIICTGDLAEALPVDEGQERDHNHWFHDYS